MAAPAREQDWLLPAAGARSGGALAAAAGQEAERAEEEAAGAVEAEGAAEAGAGEWEVKQLASHQPRTSVPAAEQGLKLGEATTEQPAPGLPGLRSRGPPPGLRRAALSCCTLSSAAAMMASSAAALANGWGSPSPAPPLRVLPLRVPRIERGPPAVWEQMTVEQLGPAQQRLRQRQAAASEHSAAAVAMTAAQAARATVAAARRVAPARLQQAAEEWAPKQQLRALLQPRRSE